VTTNQDPSFDIARGQRIRSLREQHGWPRRELAERAGVSQRSIENYEAGKGMHKKTLAALAAALGVTDPFVRTGEASIEERIDANGERLEGVEARLAELEYLTAQAAQASRRIWVSVDATLRLVLTHLASEDELAKLPDPPTTEVTDGDGPDNGDLRPERISPAASRR
jgi:transcriptional regulator with XRE-family HTH domain